jgi:hypothetical protein
MLSTILYRYFSIAYAQYQALEVAGFGHIQQDWMIPGGSALLYHAQRFVGILGGIGYDFEEVRSADVEGAGAGNEDSSGTQHFHGTEVEFLVAAQGFVEVALGLGEGRRIENDGVVAAA